LPNVSSHTEQGLRIVSPFAYGGPVASAIHRLKFSNRPELARTLARPVAERILMLAPLPDAVLVPVPSTPARIVERGYNQSALLALAIARKLSLKCRPLALERTHFAPHQIGADKAQRAAQVEGAFTVTSRALANASVILVDDVITTGATSAACAGALEAMGAHVIAIAAIARVL
jgi:ComF family protein